MMMAKADMVTCSFKMNRNLYNQYKSIITRSGKNVKGDLVQYMQGVIDDEAKFNNAGSNQRS